MKKTANSHSGNENYLNFRAIKNFYGTESSCVINAIMSWTLKINQYFTEKIKIIIKIGRHLYHKTFYCAYNNSELQGSIFNKFNIGTHLNPGLILRSKAEEYLNVAPYGALL